MSKEKRLAFAKEVKELSLEWNFTMRETMEELVEHFFTSTSVCEEQIEIEFLSLNDEELFDKLYTLYKGE